MERGLKTILWTALTILILIGVVKFIWWLTPVILTIIVISFFVRKGKEVMNRDERKDDLYQSTTNTANNSNSYSETTEDYSGEVIDVDFKDVEE